MVDMRLWEEDGRRHVTNLTNIQSFISPLSAAGCRGALELGRGGNRN